MLRRWSVLVPLVGLALGCRGADSSQAPTCELPTLVLLGETLANASEQDQVATVWSGLEAACGAALPTPVRPFYDRSARPERPKVATIQGWDAELEAMKTRACPSWVESGSRIVATAPADQRAVAAFRACEFARYEVLAPAELRGQSPLMVSWAMHQWLLDQGLTPAQAKPITRALIARERWVSAVVQPLAGQRWPVAPGVPIADGIPIWISREELQFAGETIAKLDDGELVGDDVVHDIVPRLLDAVEREVELRKAELDARGEDWRIPALLAVDAGIRQSTLARVLETLDRIGFAEYGIVVDASPYGVGRIPISTMYLGKRTSDIGPVMSVEIEFSGISLARGRDSDTRPTEVESNDYAAVTEYAKAVKQDLPGARRVVISAAPMIPVQEIVAVMAAARGPDCRADGAGCVLPELTLLREAAHEFHPSKYTLEGMRFAELESTGEGTIGLGRTGLIGRHYEPPGDPRPVGPITRVKVAKAKVEGPLDADIVRRIIRAHINEVRSCYNTGLREDPKLAGKVTVEFVISVTGKVRSSAVASNELGNADVANCIAKAVRRWTFPKPRGSTEVEVSYPFDLYVD